MSGELATLNRDLEAYRPRFDMAIPPGSMVNAGRLIQTIAMAAEKNSELLKCTRESLMMSAITAANLGLPVDGVTGQGYIIPRRDRGVLKAQFQPGYKGLITLAARASFIVAAVIVRENDPLRIVEGSENPRIEHEIVATKMRERGRPIGCYARARSHGFPSEYHWMADVEILAVRDKSQSYQANAAKSVWGMDPLSMYLKTPILFLARRLPAELLVKAATLDERSEQPGTFAYMSGGEVVIEGQAYPAERQDAGDLAKRLEAAQS